MINIFLSNLENIEDFSYEVSIPKDLTILSTLLRALKATKEPDIPFTSYETVSQDILDSHLGSFYTNTENVQDIINKYRKDFTPKEEFPGGNEDPYNLMDFFISESITLNQDSSLNNKIVKKGSTLTFFYKGQLNG